MSLVPSLLLRPDHGDDVGNGHVARCHALAEAWVRGGGAATVWSGPLREPWATRLASIGVESTEDPAGGPYDWLARDGYRSDGDAADRLHERARHVLVIDDHGLSGRPHAEIVVDQNFGASATGYPPDASRFLGPRYALVRSEFTSARPHAPAVADHASRVVCLMGGTPAAGTTRLVGQARRAIERTGLITVEVRDQEAMAAAMTTADIAVTAAGSTLLELCCMGVPSVLLVVAENQRAGARGAADAGVAINAGDIADLDPAHLARIVSSLSTDRDARRRMAFAAWTLVDGNGAARIVTAMRSRLVSLRQATSADAQRLFDWRNDEATRAASFSTEPIAWNHHVEWLERSLASVHTHLFIVEDEDGDPVAQVRFDEADDGTAEISVGVSPLARGRRVGAAAIDAGVGRLFSDAAVDRVVARIKPGNDASSASFVNADFDLTGRESTGEGGFLLYSRSRDAVRA